MKMKDEELNKNLERILRFIYQVEEKAKKELEVEKLKYSHRNLKSYKRNNEHNIHIAEEKSLYTTYNI